MPIWADALMAVGVAAAFAVLVVVLLAAEKSLVVEKARKLGR